MFIILMLFNNVQGILSLFNLKRLKCFDLPKFPNSCGKLTENMSSGKRRKQVTVYWVGQKVHSGFSTQCNGKTLNELFGQRNSLSPKIRCQCFVLMWNLWELPHLPSCHPQYEAQGPWNGGQGLSQLSQIYPSASSPISIYPSSSSHPDLLCVI